MPWVRLVNRVTSSRPGKPQPPSRSEPIPTWPVPTRSTAWSRWSSQSSMVTFFRASGSKPIPSLMKPAQKLRLRTPPFSARALIWSSVRFLWWLHRALQLLWVARAGALVSSITSQNPVSLRWLMSTSIPRRFISSTTCLPKPVRCDPESAPEPSPSSFLGKWVRVRDLTPSL